MGGTPSSGTSEQALAIGRAGSRCPPSGEAGGSRARRALPPPPVPPGSPLSHHGGPGGRGGGAAHPTFSKGRACSLPHPPRIKEEEEEEKERFKPNRGKDLVGVFFPPRLSLTGGRSPPSTPRCPPKPAPTRCRAGFLSTHHLLFIGKSEWSHFVAYASRLYL